MSIADRQLIRLHPGVRVSMSVPSFFLLPFMLTGTTTGALIHGRLARRLAGLSDIRALSLDFEIAPREDAIYWHPRLTEDPGHRWLRELLRGCAADIGWGTERMGAAPMTTPALR
jgi:DNA-binding transcriptional LysR family regulator